MSALYHYFMDVWSKTRMIYGQNKMMDGVSPSQYVTNSSASNMSRMTNQKMTDVWRIEANEWIVCVSSPIQYIDSRYRLKKLAWIINCKKINRKWVNISVLYYVAYPDQKEAFDSISR